MSAPVSLIGGGNGCCVPDCDDIPRQTVPGPRGLGGDDGADGVDGKSASTLTTDSFIQPAVDDTVSVEVEDSSQMVIGENVYVGTAGTMEITGIADATHLTLKNLGYDDNAAPTTLIVSGVRVSPSGKRGPAGADGSGTLNDLSPTDTKGDLVVDNGANNPDANLVQFSTGGAGNNGKLLHADSTQPSGLRYDSIDLAGTNSSLTSKLPVSKGGTFADNTTDARSNLGAAASGLTTASGLTVSATDKLLGRSTAGAGAVEEITATAFARTLLDDADAATARTTLGVTVTAYLLYQNQQTSGTGGGAFSNAAWRTVPLNTEVADTGSNGSVAANIVTLAAGTYRIRAWMTGYAVDGFQVRLYNVTTTSVIANGQCAVAPAGASATAEVSGRFTIGSSTQIRLEAQCATTNGTDGFGKANSFGTEIYASLELEKE